MSRYFFHVRGDGYPEEDGVGTHFARPKETRAALATFAGELLRDAKDRFWNTSDWRFEVTDEQGGTVCTLTITGKDGA